MLRYNKMFWITVDAMGEEWQRARVDARIDGDTVRLTTDNVTALHLASNRARAFCRRDTTALKSMATTVALPAVAAATLSHGRCRQERTAPGSLG